MENFNLKQTGVQVQELLDAIPDKADKATTLEGYGITDAYTKAEDDALLETKADKSDTYTKEQTDGLLDTKADNGTTLADYGITDAYTKDEVDGLLDEKADKATTLAGYGIGDAYTKAEVNSLITTPDQQYVTVEATDQTTSATDVLPATGAANTIYRVGNWDGTQYDPTNYSEYAWDGTQYVLLDTKDFTLATASDFDNPTAAQQAKIPTVGAILGCMDTTPTAGSVKPVQSGGVYDKIYAVKISESLEEKYKISSEFFQFGYILSTGEESTSAYGIITDYIPLLRNGKYIATAPLFPNGDYNAIVAVALYDSSKSFISRSSVPDINPEAIEFDFNSNVSFIRIFLIKKDAHTTYPSNWNSVQELDSLSPFYFTYESNVIDNFCKTPSIAEGNFDFSIKDENNNQILIVQNGGVKTKNFDSEKTANIGNDSDSDLSVQDNVGNVIARFYNGGFKTKNFDSNFIKGAIAQIDRYRRKRICILGDSISTFGTPDARNQNGIYCYSYYPNTSCRYSETGDVTIGGVTYDSIQFDVNKTWWKLFIDIVGGYLGINDSYRGSSVSSVRGEEHCFANQTRINHLGENGNPDLIIVYGGTNDAGAGVTIGTFNTENPQSYTAEQIAELPIDTFANAYRTMLIRLLYTYRESEIVCVLPTFTSGYYTITNLDLYAEVVKEACDFFGIKWVDIRATGISCYNKNNYFIDGIHPNEKGMKAIFDKIYKQIIFN